ncbi:MAG: glycosyltransferase family 1 protein [Lachnospiraceae bacterium]|nr:glycosyltransferase family 1 protein [Lachnospiraceae bacterium]
MIRVLHSVSNMDRAGLETMLMNYYRHIDRELIQFDFLANKPKPGAYEEEVRKLGGRIFVSPGFNPVKLPKYRKFMKNLFIENPEIQIVHAHNGALAYYALREAQRNHIPHRIAHSHNSKINWDLKWPIKQYCRANLKKAATECWGCGELAVEFYFGKEIVQNKDYILIRNAIEEERFLYNEQIRKKLRKKYHVEEKFVLGHVGRFMYQKNHTFLIDIFAEVYKHNPQAVLFLIGEGELEEKIRKQIHNLNIQDAVIFTGSIPNVNEFYQAMDVFLLPSLYEGLPVVGIEAQASGIPCIFSDTVTKEVGITDMAEFVPLNASTTVWAKEILKYAKGYERKNMAAEIVHTGYSIHTEAKKMQDRYLKMIEPAGK